MCSYQTVVGLDCVASQHLIFTVAMDRFVQPPTWVVSTHQKLWMDTHLYCVFQRYFVQLCSFYRAFPMGIAVQNSANRRDKHVYMSRTRIGLLFEGVHICPHVLRIRCNSNSQPGSSPWRLHQDRNQQLRTEKDHIAKHFQEGRAIHGFLHQFLFRPRNSGTPLSLSASSLLCRCRVCQATPPKPTAIRSGETWWGKQFGAALVCRLFG